MKEYETLFAALAAPFDTKEVKLRPASNNRQVQYVTARTVMNRLDTVLGGENWWDHYVPSGHSVICRLTIRLPTGGILTKEDAGGPAGMTDPTDDEKSAYSDAFKRAAVKFGIARYLYRDGVPDYQLEPPAPSEAATVVDRPHHAKHHDNQTGHGSGAYASPEVVAQYRRWLGGFVQRINALWLDHWTSKSGEIEPGVTDLIHPENGPWKISSHLVKWAREKKLINAPEQPRPRQREQLAAVVWERERQATEEEASRYCRKLWRAGEQAMKADEPDSEPENESQDVAEAQEA